MIRVLHSNLVAAILVVVFCGMTGAAKSAEPLRVGFRCDAPPFSYVKGKRTQCDGDEVRHNAQFSGYIVDLCAAIFEEMGRDFVARAVNASNRFNLLEAGAIDVLCDPTTVTSERLRALHFSQFVFLSGVSYLYIPGGASGKADRKIVVGHLEGTTAVSRINEMIKSEVFGVKRDELGLLAFKNHFAAINAICQSKIDFYVADRDILTWLLHDEAAKQKCKVAASRSFYSYEPYAISVSRKHPKLALEIQRALYAAVNSGAVDEALAKHFGLKNLSPLFRTLLSLYKIPAK